MRKTCREKKGIKTGRKPFIFLLKHSMLVFFSFLGRSWVTDAALLGHAMMQEDYVSCDGRNMAAGMVLLV